MLDILDVPTTHYVQEVERRRIARDLHDGVVQTLTALIADLEYFRARGLPTPNQPEKELTEHLAMWHELAADSLTSMRRALGSLRRPTEPDFQLEAAFRKLMIGLEAAHYTVKFEYIDCPVTLPFEYGSNIYAIVNEALINMRKHAHATCLQLFVFQDEGQMHISIVDDGVGMAIPDLAHASTSGYKQGLVGINERAVLLGGSVSIESVPGKGTRLDIAIPFPYDHTT